MGIVVQAIRNAGPRGRDVPHGVGGSQDAMEQIKAGGLYRATFLYNPNLAASAVTMARLIALGEGFVELVPPEVPRQVVVPAPWSRRTTWRSTSSTSSTRPDAAELNDPARRTPASGGWSLSGGFGSAGPRRA